MITTSDTTPENVDFEPKFRTGTMIYRVRLMSVKGLEKKKYTFYLSLRLDKVFSF